jgi:hypothetical protein
MEGTVRARLMASDLGVLPVTTCTSGLVGRFEIRSIQLRPHGPNLVLALGTCLEPPSKGSNRIESTSMFRFSPTGKLDHRLDRTELAPEARSELEVALQFVGVHPYMPWGIYNLVSAMFPNAPMFAYESRLIVTDDHPTSDYDEENASVSTPSLPATLSALPGHTKWLLQTVRAGDRSAQLEHVELELGDKAHCHFACAIRITGPGKDRRLYAAHCWFNDLGDQQLAAPIQATARGNVQRFLAEVLEHEPDDLVPHVLDALLHPSERTWRDWVESGALGTLLQPHGFLAKANADAVSLTLRSPRQRVGRGLAARSTVDLDLELEVETDGRTSVLPHVLTLGSFEMLGDVPLKSTAFLERPSVPRAASKYQHKVQGRLEALAKAWSERSHEWTTHLGMNLRDDSLLETLVSAHRSGSASEAASAASQTAAPRAIVKGDKVSHKTFGIGVVIAV